jgi:hypothetical protein
MNSIKLVKHGKKKLLNEIKIAIFNDIVVNSQNMHCKKNKLVYSNI